MRDIEPGDTRVGSTVLDTLPPCRPRASDVGIAMAYSAMTNGDCQAIRTPIRDTYAPCLAAHHATTDQSKNRRPLVCVLRGPMQRSNAAHGDRLDATLVNSRIGHSFAIHARYTLHLSVIPGWREDTSSDHHRSRTHESIKRVTAMCALFQVGQDTVSCDQTQRHHSSASSSPTYFRSDHVGQVRIDTNRVRPLHLRHKCAQGHAFGNAQII